MERMKLKVTPARLRLVMRRKRLGVRDLAAMAGTSPSTVSRLATGVQAICRGDLGIRIEQALNETVGSLFNPEPPPGPASSEVVAGATEASAVPEMAHESDIAKSREAAA